MAAGHPPMVLFGVYGFLNTTSKKLNMIDCTPTTPWSHDLVTTLKLQTTFQYFQLKFEL